MNIPPDPYSSRAANSKRRPDTQIQFCLVTLDAETTQGDAQEQEGDARDEKGKHTAWALAGKTYAVKERIKNEFGGVWHPGQKCWLLKGIAEKECERIVGILQADVDERTQEKKEQGRRKRQKTLHEKKAVREDNRKQADVCEERRQEWIRMHRDRGHLLYFETFTSETGECGRCGHNIFKMCDPRDTESAEARTGLIMGCPYCSRSFLD